MKSLTIGAAFAFLVWAGYMCAVVSADTPPRFERISDEHKDGRFNHAVAFEVWHDRVSGQEFVCVESNDTNSTGGADGKAWPLSCFPTGRKW